MFKVLILSVITGLIGASHLQPFNKKSIDAIRDGLRAKFTKNAASAGAAKSEILRKVNLRADKTSGFVTISMYAETTCGTKKQTSGSAVNECIVDDDESSMYTTDGTDFTITDYTDAVCTPANGVSNTLSLNTCVPEMMAKASYSSSPEYTDVNMIYFETAAKCTSNSADGIINYVGQTSATANGVDGLLACNIAYDENDNPDGYAKMSCSGDTVVYTFYAGDSCTGAPTSSYTSASASTCSDDLGNSRFYCPQSDDKAAACFAGSETVQSENGDKIAISDVKVGDRILSANIDGKFVFSDVISVPHLKNDIMSRFVVINTESGFDVKMTEDHLIPAGSCSSIDLKLTRASDVEVGACVQTTEGMSPVVAVNMVEERGIYTVVTKEKFIVVNGIVASPFAVNHEVTNLFYDLYRLAYAFFPGVMASKAFMGMHETFAQVIAKTI